MEYLAFYQMLKKDRLVNKIIKEKMPYKSGELKRGDRMTLSEKTILLIEKGALLKHNPFRNDYFIKTFMPKTYVIALHDFILPFELEAIEDVVFRKFDLNYFLSYLEEEQLLSSFFLEELEAINKRNKIKCQMLTMAAEQRVLLTLKLIVGEILTGKDQKRIVLPQWLTISIIAKLSNCSRTIASATMQQLYRKDIIEMKNKHFLVVCDKLFAQN